MIYSVSIYVSSIGFAIILLKNQKEEEEKEVQQENKEGRRNTDDGYVQNGPKTKNFCSL